MLVISFKFDRLVLAAFIERRSPDLVRSLVVSAAETELGSKTPIELAGILQDVVELLGIELRSATVECSDQDACRTVVRERHGVGCLAGKIFGNGSLVFENNA